MAYSDGIFAKKEKLISRTFYIDEKIIFRIRKVT